MKKVGVYILFISLLIFLSFLYGVSSNRNQYKKIKDIEVLFVGGGNNYLTHSEVNKMLIQKQQSVAKKTKRKVDLHLLEGDILLNPYVEKADVFFTIDGLLKTTIKQRTPVARIVNESDSYYVDKFGHEMPLSKKFSARVLLISGVKKKQDIANITKLVNVILTDDFLTKEIIAIQKKQNNHYEFKVRSGDYIVDFGKLEHVNQKFKKLKVFYNKAFVDKTINKYRRINVEYHNQVVCTK